MCTHRGDEVCVQFVHSCATMPKISCVQTPDQIARHSSLMVKALANIRRIHARSIMNQAVQRAARHPRDLLRGSLRTGRQGTASATARSQNTTRRHLQRRIVCDIRLDDVDVLQALGGRMQMDGLGGAAYDREDRALRFRCLSPNIIHQRRTRPASSSSDSPTGGRIPSRCLWTLRRQRKIS